MNKTLENSTNQINNFKRNENDKREDSILYSIDYFHWVMSSGHLSNGHLMNVNMNILSDGNVQVFFELKSSNFW